MVALQPTRTAGAIFAIFQPGDENPNRKVGDGFPPAYRTAGAIFAIFQPGDEKPNRKVGDSFPPAYKNAGRDFASRPT
jgi:hypothetical protein